MGGGGVGDGGGSGGGGGGGGVCSGALPPPSPSIQSSLRAGLKGGDKKVVKDSRRLGSAGSCQSPTPHQPSPCMPGGVPVWDFSPAG